MKAAIALTALQAGSLVWARDISRNHHHRDTTLPDLDETQSNNAIRIMTKGSSMRLGKAGCMVAISAALGETSIYVYANKRVPISVNEVHDKDKVATTGDGIGLYMQSNAIYNNIHCSMHQTCATFQFFETLRKIKDWEKLPVGEAAFQVQGTHDAAYFETFVAKATKICGTYGK